MSLRTSYQRDALASVYRLRRHSDDGIISSDKGILKTGVLLFCSDQAHRPRSPCQGAHVCSGLESASPRQIDLDLAVDRAAKSQRIE